MKYRTAEDSLERAGLFLRLLYGLESHGHSGRKSALPPRASEAEDKGDHVQMRPGQSGQRPLMVSVTKVTSQAKRCLVALLVR